VCWCVVKKNLKELRKQPPQPPQKRPINFFLNTLLYRGSSLEKTAPPPVASPPVTRTLIPLSYFLNHEKSHFLKFQGSGVKDSGNTRKCLHLVPTPHSPEKRKPLNLFWLSGLYGSCAWGRTKDLAVVNKDAGPDYAGNNNRGFGDSGEHSS